MDARVHPAAPIILGDNTYTSCTAKSASLCTSTTCPLAHMIRVRPDVPIQLHAAPRKSMSAQYFGRPTASWPPTFRATTFVHGPPQFTATIVHGLLWASTKFWTAITLYGRPRKILGLGQPHTSTKSLGDHAIIWTPTKFCGQPRNRVGTQRRRFLDGHVICMGTHEVLWGCTRDMWTAKPRLFWAPTHISWTANNDKPWAPKHVANIPHFGPPQRYEWSSTLLHWPPTLRIGRPRSLMGTQQLPSWAPTRFYGQPREFVDAHV